MFKLIYVCADISAITLKIGISPVPTKNKKKPKNNHAIFSTQFNVWLQKLKQKLV